VLLPIDLTPNLKESDESEDLQLGGIRDGVPGLWGVGNFREWRTVHLHGPWELKRRNVM
jgi:hypothetical protein